MAPAPAVKVPVGFSCNKVSILVRHPDSKDSVRLEFHRGFGCDSPVNGLTGNARQCLERF